MIETMSDEIFEVCPTVAFLVSYKLGPKSIACEIRVTIQTINSCVYCPNSVQRERQVCRQSSEAERQTDSRTLVMVAKQAGRQAVGLWLW